MLGLLGRSLTALEIRKVLGFSRVFRDGYRGKDVHGEYQTGKYKGLKSSIKWTVRKGLTSTCFSGSKVSVINLVLFFLK